MSEYAKRTTIYTNIDSDDDTDAAAAQRHYRVVLCGSNAYDKKYYINPKFSGLPETVKEELRIICCLFTEEVGGVFTVNLTPGGEVVLESEADEDDLLYDDIGCGLLIRQVRDSKKELFDSLSIYFKVHFLHMDPSELLEEDALAPEESLRNEETADTGRRLENGDDYHKESTPEDVE